MTTLRAIRGAPGDLSKKLRELADEVDAGDIFDMVVACNVRNERAFVFGASLEASLVLSDLLRERCLERMRED